MKKNMQMTAALLGALAAPYAAAQSSVTIYGSIDAGIAYLNNAGGHAAWQAEEGNTQPNRWGLKGKEDLGGGMSTIFVLENGFSTLNGASTKSGSMFNRFAYLGLASERYGTVTLGHQSPFSYFAVGRFAVANEGLNYRMFHPGNIDELTNSSTVQTDNTVRYVSPTFYGLSAGAMLGMGNTSNFGYQRSTSFGLMYNNGPISAGAAYADENNRSFSIGNTALSLGTFQGVNLTTGSYVADKARNLDVGGAVSLGPWNLHVVYSHVRLYRLGFASTFQTLDGGVDYRVTPANLITAGAFSSKLDDKRWHQFGLSDIYSLSKATQIYVAGLYQMANHTNAAIYNLGPSSTKHQFAALTGIHHSF